jgi:hypothetical protein
MKHSLIALAVATFAIGAQASAQQRVELGLLTCKLKDVHNDIVYTSEEFDCVFKPKSGDDQTYTGQIRSLGIDLSVTKDMTLVWGVLAPTGDAASTETLKGKYVGGGAAVALGVGAGADVLVGGGENSFTLQPVSVSGMVGAGASVGIEEFELR